MKKTQWVRKRHYFYMYLFKGIVRLVMKLTYGIKAYKFKLAKNENALILSNHQTDFDPVIVGLSINKPVYHVATDSLFSSKFASNFLGHCFAPIPKKKGFSDPRCIKTILKVAKEKGTICIFAEGNRSYAEFQYHIDDSLARLVKALKIPLIIYNIKGGNGVSPRFALKKRKGKFTGQVVKKIEAEEYLKMSDEELMTLIKETIKVFDSDSKELYKSNKRAECLERMLFVCPCCHKVNTIYSKNEFVYCSNCNLKVEYTEDLHLKSVNESCKYSRLVEWYDFQKDWCRNATFKDDEIIFEDEIKLFESNVNQSRKLLFEGKMQLTNKELRFGGKIVILLENLEIASPISGRKFNFSTLENNYLVVGNERFNPLKYVLMFNRLDTLMHTKHIDKYFELD